MRFLRVLLGVFLLIVLIVFAILNRAPVEINLDPILPYALALPLYLLVFIVFFAGLVIGVLGDRWNAAAAARRRSKAAKERAAKEAAAPTGTALARTSDARPAEGNGAPPLPPGPVV